MRCLVTGAAGFVGSHLCEELVRQGHSVAGLDAFIPYYDIGVKQRNLGELKGQTGFAFHQLDLRRDQLEKLVGDAEVIFHLAAMPGLVKSWTDFEGYWTCNVEATRRLLEAWVAAGNKSTKLIYVSTSSVYGKFGSGDEDMALKPTSPYGVTKLAGEHLCRAYADIHGIPLVILRYFSVYGPRQRPDMGYHKFINAALHKQTVIVYGDGHQARGNTYVADCVSATIAAVNAVPGELFNVGGGEIASVWEILRRLEEIGGGPIQVRQEPARPGDQRYTFADTSKLRRHLGWHPCTTLAQGLKVQWDWQQRELELSEKLPKS